jgi:hypothetical protein
MNPESLVADTERELRALSSELTEPHEGECLLCYVHRMLEHGCTGLRWATRYRDVRAPRATALARRLGRKGGFCDCEIFLNGYELAREHWTSTPEHEDEDGVLYGGEWSEPEQVPDCRGVRGGSTKGCALWVPQRQQQWW